MEFNNTTDRKNIPISSYEAEKILKKDVNSLCYIHEELEIFLAFWRMLKPRIYNCPKKLWF